MQRFFLNSLKNIVGTNSSEVFICVSATETCHIQVHRVQNFCRNTSQSEHFVSVIVVYRTESGKPHEFLDLLCICADRIVSALDVWVRLVLVTQFSPRGGRWVIPGNTVWRLIIPARAAGTDRRLGQPGWTGSVPILGVVASIGSRWREGPTVIISLRAPHLGCA